MAIDKDEDSADDVARMIGGHHVRLDVASEADRAVPVETAFCLRLPLQRATT